MNILSVDVAIIGAGSAGLAALAQVRRVTNNYVVVDSGPLGTTCARVGCMPSKVLIQVAAEYSRRYQMEERGIHNGPKLSLNIPETFAYIRKLRDRFTRGVVQSTEHLGRRLIMGRARFLGPCKLQVGQAIIRAKRVILATGSRPILPIDYIELGSRVVTTDTLFELEDLPPRLGVIGLGSLGLEVGQALARLGCGVEAFDRSPWLGDLTDPAVNLNAVRYFTEEFPIHLRCEVKLRPGRKSVSIVTPGRSYKRDLIIACLGRRPNLDSMGLETTGAAFDESGIPLYDRATMRLNGLPIYIAGDASAQRATLHEASDDGRIAGANSVRARPRRFTRRAPLSITFCEPNIATVGRKYRELKRGEFVIGTADFKMVSRALIMGQNRGLLRVYAGCEFGELLGAEMMGPDGEHLAHLMSWAIQQRLTVFEMLRMPFYHPVIEEGLRTALREAAHKVPQSLERREGSLCDQSN